jgi:hypothetical protein
MEAVVITTPDCGGRLKDTVLELEKEFMNLLFLRLSGLFSFRSMQNIRSCK